MAKSCVQILTLLAIWTCVIQGIAGRCNVCNSNGLACISETSFQLCVDGVRQTSQTFACPNDSICVGARLRCAPRDSGVAAECAAPSEICGQCDGINMFTCTSRTTFVQCNGTVPIGTDNACPADRVCDATQAEICVSSCRAPASPQCTNEAS